MASRSGQVTELIGYQRSDDNLRCDPITALARRDALRITYIRALVTPLCEHDRNKSEGFEKTRG